MKMSGLQYEFSRRGNSLFTPLSHVKEQRKLLFTEKAQVYKDFLNMSIGEQLSLIFNKFEKPVVVYHYDSWYICKTIVNK